MKDLSKQVVILDNLPSQYIHQAIIILKNYTPENQQKIITEAEQIVSEYFHKNPPNNVPHNIERKDNFRLKCAVTILSIALTISTLVNFIT